MSWLVPTPPTAEEFVRQRFEQWIKPLLECTDPSDETIVLNLIGALLTEARLKVDGNFQAYVWKLVRPKLEQFKGVVGVRDEAGLRQALYRFMLEAKTYRLRDG